MRTLYIFIITICIALIACGKEKSDTTAIEGQPPSVLPAGFAKGADIGWLSEMEDAGRKFNDNKGNAMDCIDLLKSKGINSIRLRVWVNPATKYSSKADVLALAIRAKNKGMRLMIDFHYSDNWADPGKQVTPAAWKNYDLPALQKAVYEHTYDVLSILKANGITPEWVQVGNESNTGFMYPLGDMSTNNGANYAMLTNSGYDAVKAVNPAIKVIVHVSNGYDNKLFRWHFDNMVTNGAKFDMIGMSLYPPVDSWQTYTANLLSNMQDMIARYGKPIVISEVGMNADAAKASKDMLTDVLTKTASLGANGVGVFYWEPEAYNWKNYPMGAFDSSGKPTIAMDAFLLN
ncbi:glycoside hydrolase family 53 protein [Mucilaginibacter boryungensis]|uniref:Arabinogalactan endo-beta-1,4-galactanase n=1 Tax=Mucilaginibacter boryungensis TaxID=768480 RepID=A0ABR9XFG0_9SPHI|nr:glycosyl hydrolase 53 family protein [Mucilaginibacter boryungensis]MBE9665800.1 glycosyl hydrolase 53 family protein [Mucilaginibacter boryungensis]